MTDNVRKVNIHFDIEALRNAYAYAVNHIGFEGALVN